MFEIISKTGQLYNVLDTEDGAIDSCSFLDIISAIQSGVAVNGVSCKDNEYLFEIDGSKVHAVMKGYKFRLYPNKDQQTYFQKCFGCCRFVWNKMLADKIDWYNKHGENIYIRPAYYKTDFPFLKEVDSLALNSEYNSLNTAFTNFFGDTRVGYEVVEARIS